MVQRERSTYLRDDEILERVEAYLEEIQHVLQQRRTSEAESERVHLLVDALAEQQEDMIEALTRFEEDAPKNMRETYSQYTLDVPEKAPPMPEPLTADELTRWLLAANQPVVDLFRELGEKAENPSIGQIFEALEQQFRSQNQRISKIASRFADL
jgi:DNA-binding FadR family transcriptional regulator